MQPAGLLAGWSRLSGTRERADVLQMTATAEAAVPRAKTGYQNMSSGDAIEQAFGPGVAGDGFDGDAVGTEQIVDVPACRLFSRQMPSESCREVPPRAAGVHVTARRKVAETESPHLDAQRFGNDDMQLVGSVHGC